MLFKPKKSLNFIPEYKPGKSFEDLKEQYPNTDLIKLSSNENPLGSAVSLSDIKDSELNRYPHQASSGLLNKCAEKHNVSEKNIILGNGSDEIFQFLTGALLEENDEVISSEHTFSMYEIDTHLFSGKYIPVKMTNLEHNLKGFIEAITNKTKLIFIANPNNPTGTYIEPDKLTSFIKQVPKHVVVVIDEAYADYVPEDKQLCIQSTISSFENVIITRTFSKIYGIAGLRLGYGIASEKLITLLQKVRPPFNVNNVSLRAGILALENTTFVEKSIQTNIYNKEKLIQFFKSNNINYTTTHANFILVSFSKRSNLIYEYFNKYGIIIRDCSSFGLGNSVRITIGSDDDTEKLITVFEKLIKEI